MKASNGFRYIFLLVDVYTLFMVATALDNKRSETIEKEISKVFAKYGKPENFETDEGIFF